MKPNVLILPYFHTGVKRVSPIFSDFLRFFSRPTDFLFLFGKSGGAIYCAIPALRRNPKSVEIGGMFLHGRNDVGASA